MPNQYNLFKAVHTFGPPNKVTNNDLEGAMYQEIVNSNVFNIKNHENLYYEKGKPGKEYLYVDGKLIYGLIKRSTYVIGKGESAILHLPTGWSVLRDPVL